MTTFWKSDFIVDTAPLWSICQHLHRLSGFRWKGGPDGLNCFIALPSARLSKNQKGAINNNNKSAAVFWLHRKHRFQGFNLLSPEAQSQTRKTSSNALGFIWFFYHQKKSDLGSFHPHPLSQNNLQIKEGQKSIKDYKHGPYTTSLFMNYPPRIVIQRNKLLS